MVIARSGSSGGKNHPGLPGIAGQELIQYVDEEGVRRDVTSADVNEYLKEITGKDITAKDFRTWAGTVLAAMTLSELESFDSAAQAKRNLRNAIEKVSARLGNTPTICRKCYIHPEILNAYLDGALLLEIQKDIDDRLRDELSTLHPEEAAVLSFLRERVARELAAGAQAPVGVQGRAGDEKSRSTIESRAA